ncbi:MAG: peroxiredoxin [Candidatus Poseidoniales archaeon]|jgi:peroxiredoxin Q/BCP|tara:strand:- start:1097 stop:1573 length:477 start_codon:yes stop_codon:yes gene_type:complete
MSSLIGSTALPFSLKTSDDEEFSLSDLDGQWKVIFFYAKDGSPTCKRGCLSFKDQYELFRSLKPPVEVIGISQDTVEQHKEFKQELQLPFTLLSDPGRKVATEYEVANHLGIFPAKSTFLLGPDNTIHHVYDWLFRPRTHVAKILSAMSNVTDGAGFS